MMHIATVVLFLVVILHTFAAGAEVIRVVSLDASDSAAFNCGDRCKFRGSLPSAPLRVRIIRGTVSELAIVANDRRYTAAGCIELYSTVVRPRRSRRTADLLDLKFYFSTRWLGSNGANGNFVFIIERDDTPTGPIIERTSMLRLPAGPDAARYFRAGVDVEVRAPVHVRRSGFLAMLARPFAAMAATTTATERPSSGVIEHTLPEATPQPTSSANCVDLQIDRQPVLFRRADAPPQKIRLNVAGK
ncbi:MAG TPA: hypothetical protein VF883_04535 [Thermoanaerobaculia bacterium]|jgi:hypothetical protein